MSVVAFAPASTANVSVGFDVLGAAMAPLDGTLLGDRVLVADTEGDFALSKTGAFAHKLPDDFKQNIVYDCYLAYEKALEQKGISRKPLVMTLEKSMPVGSGLGSSATSIVAAFVALNAFYDEALSEHELMLLMGELEGQISGSVHYDNVAPCHFGGMQLVLDEAGVVSQTLPSFDDWYWVLCYPGISVSTSAARSILPAQYRRQDCLTYGRRLAGFVHASHTGQEPVAAAMLKDVIAEPYRAQLIPGFVEVREQAAAMGALATGISGSGPTVFCVLKDLSQAEKLKAWLAEHFIQNQDGFCHICKIDAEGARVTGTEL
ncbi:homoserine kinase [Oceanisphaera arctica]|uniref:Homoserine kinase n=1 Tax=Oceanisphaera arctica TaxID=641510 RepID=A0A2P5TKG0_9GAMM|nr:homoserine kinase [Oceanisphaera arctica]PPL15625.1 homoserine kinase [Oceanisphaera arctica]GHA25910.1 homoserine kinase [Oceanisphaera arctica]